MTLFKNMTRDQKIAHLEECLGQLSDNLEYEHVVLQDTWDWQEEWIPWLLKEVKGAKR